MQVSTIKRIKVVLLLHASLLGRAALPGAVMCMAGMAAPRAIAQATVAANAELPNAPGARATGALASEPTQAAGNGAISGTVLDPNGNIVENAHVVVTNRAGTHERTVESGANGQFNFVDLPAGSYRLRVTGNGMGTYVSELFLLHSRGTY